MLVSLAERQIASCDPWVVMNTLGFAVVVDDWILFLLVDQWVGRTVEGHLAFVADL